MIKSVFKKSKVYKKTPDNKYHLVKCENTDGSLSYRLADKSGLPINDSYNFPHSFEDVISVHPDHHLAYNEMFEPQLKKSVLGEKLDEEMSKIQHSFYTILEEVIVRI